MKLNLLVLLFAISGCGPDEIDSPVIEETIKLPPGKYGAFNTVISSEGTCSWIEKGLTFAVDVDGNGNIVAPLSDTTCLTSYITHAGVTSYADIKLRCYSSYLNFVATGNIYIVQGYAPWAYGNGTLWGNIGGCTRVDVNWKLYRQP